MFFARDEERPSARRRRQELAKQVCARCPVIEQCREASLRRGEPFGVWGGLGEAERTDLLIALGRAPMWWRRTALQT